MWVTHDACPISVNKVTQARVSQAEIVDSIAIEVSRTTRLYYVQLCAKEDDLLQIVPQFMADNARKLRATINKYRLPEIIVGVSSEATIFLDF